MLNIIIYVLVIGVLSNAFAAYFDDVWLRDAQKSRLREKFENWWKTVQDLEKLKLALACTISLNGILDKVFGVRVFSKLAFWRTSFAATGLLIASLALIGLFNHEQFGIEPWKNYRETAEGVEKFIPELQSRYEGMPATTLVTNVLPKIVGSTILTTNVICVTNTAAAFAVNGLEKVESATKKYNTNLYVVIYGIVSV